MKAYQIQTPNGIDGLKLVDLPEPKPGVGQILIRVRATSLNYRDTAVVSGNISIIGCG
jgi:NADPH:quinone reductase-like Zn-dependent oxidoreductase